MPAIVHTFTILLSLFTATGVFIHDGRIDRAFGSGSGSIQAVYAKRTATKYTGNDLGLNTDPHTHPSHASAGLKGFAQKNNPNPIYPPREQKMKKYLQQNIEPRGRHAFDNHYLPLVG